MHAAAIIATHLTAAKINAEFITGELPPASMGDDARRQWRAELRAESARIARAVSMAEYYGVSARVSGIAAWMDSCMDAGDMMPDTIFANARDTMPAYDALASAAAIRPRDC